MHNPSHLGEKKVGHLLWDYSMPAITGMIVNALYNVVDSIFVGNGVGAIGLAAVAISFPIIIILMGCGMLVGVGATALVSIRIGEGRKGQAEQILGNAFVLITILALLLTAVILYFLDPILLVLGSDEAILPYARDFTRIIVSGSIFMFIGFGLNNIIRAEGSPKTAMATMLISAIMNIILNPLFIFGLKLGISGSALATLISQAISAAWVLLYFTSNRSFLTLRMLNMKPDLNIVLGILSIGMSPFFMQVAAGIVSFFYNQSLLHYGGEVAVAAMGIINRISMLLLMPIFGLSQGAQPIIGFNYGAGNIERVKETLKQAIIAATLISLAGFIIIQLFSTDIIKLFNNDIQLIEVGSLGLRIFLFMLPIIGFQVVGTIYFQAVGKAKQSIFLSLSRQVIVLIPMILVLPGIFGLKGIWLAGAVADLSSFVITGLMLYWDMRQYST